MKERNAKRELLLTGALALLFGFFLAAGAALDGGGSLGYGIEHYAADVSIDWLNPSFYLAILIYALPTFAVLLLLWRALDWIATKRAQHLLEKDPSDTSDSPLGVIPFEKKWFWLGALALFVCWLPYWLGLWPGIFNYDAHFQYEMLANANLQTHHPLLHTLLLDGFVLFGEHVLGSVNAGVVLYLLLALVVTALTFSWMLYTMAEEGAGKALLICSFLFLAINPAVVVWLVSTNKDVLFTDFLLLTALCLYRYTRYKKSELDPSAKETSYRENPGKARKGTLVTRIRRTIHPVPTTAALVLFCLVIAVLAFRTSAVYSFVLFLPLAFLLLRKRLRKSLMTIMVAATTVFVVFYIVVIQLITQVPSGPWQTLDALTIPRQQLARVWVMNEDPEIAAAYQQIFSPEDLEYLSKYEADDADPSRSAFRTAFEERPLELLGLYNSMGVKHPGTYLDAALLLSYEAWYPGAVTDGYIVEGYFATPGVARSSYIDVSAFPPAEEAWIIPGFGEWLKQFGLGNVGLDLAPVRLLCSPAFFMWILAIVLVRTLCVQDKRGALVATLLFVFGLTALLSPLVVMRYYLMVMVATPLLLHIASSPSWQVPLKLPK